jgi:hypothetical protein
LASIGRKFDATSHDTTQRDAAENVPDGIYRLEMDSSDVGPSSSGNGIILKGTVAVLEPEDYKGARIFVNYNLEHSNAQAQEIGQKQFAALCRAVGVSEVDDSEQLHHKSFTATIGLGKDSKEKNADGSPKYAARSEIKRYWFPDEGNVPEPKIADKQPARPAANDNRQAAMNDNKPAENKTAAAGGSARPWKR